MRLPTFFGLVQARLKWTGALWGTWCESWNSTIHHYNKFFWQVHRKLVWRTSVVVFSQTRFLFWVWSAREVFYFLWRLTLTRFFTDTSALCFWKMSSWKDGHSYKEVQKRWHCPGGGGQKGVPRWATERAVQPGKHFKNPELVWLSALFSQRPETHRKKWTFGLFLPACLLTPRYEKKTAHWVWCGWAGFGAYGQHPGRSERTPSFENKRSVKNRFRTQIHFGGVQVNSAVNQSSNRPKRTKRTQWKEMTKIQFI